MPKRVHIIDNGSFYTSLLADLLPNFQVTIQPYDQLSPRDVAPDDVVILSGGHIFPVLWHDQEYSKERYLIQHHQGAVIGICLGAQLIAHTFGAHLHHLKQFRKGVIKIKATDSSHLLDLPTSISVYENHHFAIEHVPQPLYSLARSADGIEVFGHHHRPLYGLQFHPEVKLAHNQGYHLFDQLLFLATEHS
jgi:GMP synthase-like glutamine amidotransferase